MKTKNLFIIILLLIVGGISMEISAQANLEAVVKKCESLESVNMTIVKNRNPNTKKMSNVITSISIKSDPALVNEFLEAFKKDEPNATQVIDSKKNGKIIPEYYSFGEISYSFSMKENGNASVSIIDNRKQ